VKEIMKLSIEENEKQTEKKQKELCDMKIEKITTELKNTNKLKNIRKEIARLKTALNQKRREV
jgi:large subunit ribosomal protein L29